MTTRTTATTTETSTDRRAECSPADRVTKSLLGYGIIAGPIYVTVSLAQAFTREGFDASRHALSLLANGEHGWIQIANLIGCGPCRPRSFSIRSISGSGGVSTTIPPPPPWA